MQIYTKNVGKRIKLTVTRLLAAQDGTWVATAVYIGVDRPELTIVWRWRCDDYSVGAQFLNTIPKDMEEGDDPTETEAKLPGF